ncbi:MAG TPA: SusC/RagA family TonB-linked outer membrane protein [Longimicrobiaceae bacterium]|jgi:TonB-linked SusC/RagA family outer membrane protein
MKNFRWLLAFALAIAAVPGQVLAQATGTVAGRVTDPQQQPVPGAQIVVVGGAARAVTGQDGSYRLTGVRAGSAQVSATRIGFDTRTQTVNVAAGATATADFTLSSSVLEIGGLVVTASGREQRTRELGNAVGSINVEQVELAAVPSMSSLLQGRAAGVSVTQQSGTSGSASRIRIRGSNSVSLSNEPLVIVDGVRVTSDATSTLGTWQTPSRLNDLNPEDIENIEVLKGPAAAALYGTAAANGVIQVTTKRGRVGAPRWSLYSDYTSIRDQYDYPASFRSTSGCIIWDLAEGDCTAAELAPDSIISFNPLETPGFSPFIDGNRKQLGLSVSGGSDAATYYLSGDWEDEQGVYEENKVGRYNLRANVTARVSEKLNLTIKSGYSNSDVRLPPNDNDLYGYLLNGLLGSADSTVARGTYGIAPDETSAFTYQQEAKRFTGSLNANYRPLEWLSIVGTAGLDQLNRDDNELVPPNRVSPVYSSLIPIGYRESNQVDITNFTGTLDATGTFNLSESLVSTSSLGIQHNREDYHDTRAFGRGLAPGTESLNGTSQLFSVGENTVQNSTVGAYGQQQFSFSDRLFLTAALRGDDNSAFGTGTNFVWYPSLSTSWVLSDEPFFPSVPALSNLRLRAAWGKSGLRPSFRDAITYFSPVSARVSGSDVTAVTLSGTGNPDLKPEVSTELEVGADIGLFSDRLGLELTYYDKLSEDALVQRRLSPSLGLTTSRYDNIGSVSNTGFEATLNARVLELPSLQWDFSLSASTNKNELVELGEGIEPIIFGSNRLEQRHIEGYPLGGFWGKKVSYQDVNGDGLLTVGGCSGTTAYPAVGCEAGVAAESDYIGSPLPTREVAFSTNVTLFDFVKVSGLLDYKGGHTQMNFTRFDRCSWEVICEAAFVPTATNLKDQAGVIAFSYLEPSVNTYVYYEDSDFLKLRELSLTLMAPDRFASRFGMSGLRLTVSGRNLATWTDYSGFDPEVNSFGLSNFQTYDYYTQAPLRYYTARIDVNF